MKTIKNIVLPFCLLMLFAACQDVIEIDLDSIEPKLVIDGAVTNNSDSIVVKISKSTDYFEPGIYPAVSNARVTISDDAGNSEELEETSPGVYSKNWDTAEGVEYALEVDVDGQKYFASATLPHKVSIDSVSIEPTPDYMEFSGGYLINCHLHDPAGIENYYRLIVSKINDSTKGNQLIYLFDDAFVDGNEISMQWDNGQFLTNDTVIVELQTLDESTYNYYRTLSSVFEGGMIGNANPSNPVTNLSNGALGYFGAYTISRDTLLVSPEALKAMKANAQSNKYLTSGFSLVSVAIP
ncbi:MAG: DUF4249 domain-containing protein [Bacteroidales bacterium]|nr:DUF4249 domain-containing protein [Bacteroidales bacterium]MCF8459028.1 DUF4249 domain-containing protein [Bacteroidales bacterium]